MNFSFYHYDSNSQKVEFKQSWMDQLTRDDPDYLERETRALQGHQERNKHNIEILKNRFNQTGGQFTSHVSPLMEISSMETSL